MSRTRPLALVLEDVQRDPEVGSIAIEMTEAARRDRGRVLAVLTLRSAAVPGEEPEVARTVASEAAAGADAAVVRLEPLGREEMPALVGAVFRPNDFETSASWLVDELLSLSGGNPLHLAELLRTLRSHGAGDAGLVTTREGLWTAGPDLTRERLRQLVPPRIEQLVVERLRELPEDVRRFVRAAAVLGDVFEASVLRTLLQDPPTFEASLAALEEEGLLREIDGGRIRFREPLLPEALHRDLRASDPMEHARLHAAAAERLLTEPGARTRNALRLARHLLQAGKPGSAFPALLDAARRLIDRQA
jgi:predicted ATPase